MKENKEFAPCSYERCLTCKCTECFTGKTARELGRIGYDIVLKILEDSEIVGPEELETECIIINMPHKLADMIGAYYSDEVEPCFAIRGLKDANRLTLYYGVAADGSRMCSFEPIDEIIINRNKNTLSIDYIRECIEGIYCPNCGCNPQDEPYCMVPTHCPQCGYIFKEE